MDVPRWLRTQWDRFGGWACIVAGALALLLGWIGMSSKSYPAEQLPYILSGGIFGVFLLGLGGILLLSADLRDEWTKLDRIEARMAAGEELPSQDRPVVSDPAANAVEEGGTPGAAVVAVRSIHP